MPLALRWLVALLFGSLSLTLGDQLHVRLGVLSYRQPFLFGQAVWVPGVFFFAAAAGLVGLFVGAWVSGTLRDLTEAHADRWGTREAVYAAVWLAVAYGISGPLQDHPRALLAGYALTYLWRCYALGVPWLWFHGALFALGGTLFEATLSSTGAFTYACPDIVGVPWWLPGIYLHAIFLPRAVLRRWLLRA